MNDEKLEVICDSISQHPYCSHGPTLLFCRRNKLNNEIIEEYFACSAYRSLNGCKFHLLKSDYDKGKMKTIQQKLPLPLDRQKITEIRRKILNTDENKRYFCHSCNVLFLMTDLNNKHEGHDIQIGVTDYQLKMPTELLRPQSNDKAEAQYFFTTKTLEFFLKFLKELEIRKICCIGAPRLHEHLKFSYKNYKIDSFLLDLDHRFFYFYDDNEFAWFNMFNFHFFEGNTKRDIFDNFLKVNGDETCCLFIDPPFGCRTEPLIKTIKEISTIYKHINKNSSKILPIIWIFPYFMEIYIKKFMPEMEMIDYHINYDNHDKYTNFNNNNLNARKYGSPIRFFTNISSNLINLPSDDGYKFCDKCNKWTYKENLHCHICNECPSKNGETYRHCNLCIKCVKPSYQHCIKCGYCVQKQQHQSCELYQKQLICSICKRLGHTELKCYDWFIYSKRKYYKTHSKILYKLNESLKNGARICLICTKVNNHHEKKCPKRKYFLKEKYFLSECVNIFKKLK